MGETMPRHSAIRKITGKRAGGPTLIYFNLITYIIVSILIIQLIYHFLLFFFNINLYIYFILTIQVEYNYSTDRFRDLPNEIETIQVEYDLVDENTFYFIVLFFFSSVIWMNLAAVYIFGCNTT